MPLARLLACALLLCGLSAFGQSHLISGTAPDNLFANSPSDVASGRPSALNFTPCCAAAATSAKPWKVTSTQTADAGAQNDPLDRMKIEEYKVDKNAFSRNSEQSSYLDRSQEPNLTEAILAPPLQPERKADYTCLAIRSYVVARDSKDSDSTHPVRYSTCQPSDRYRVKSADIHVSPAEH